MGIGLGLEDVGFDNSVGAMDDPGDLFVTSVLGLGGGGGADFVGGPGCCLCGDPGGYLCRSPGGESTTCDGGFGGDPGGSVGDSGGKVGEPIDKKQSSAVEDWSHL